MPSLSASQWTPYPVELVFAFFANPNNLPHLMPNWQKARIESARVTAPPPRPVAQDPALRFQSPAAGVGSEITVSFRAVPGIPLRAGWIAEITEFEWFSHFRDTQTKGPFATWHHFHGIAAEARDGVAGSLVTDEVEYTVPLGPLGTLADALFVHRQLEATFAYRRKRLDEILPVASRQARAKRPPQ
jgi:ligand-binding SRPBCC domain-containing protein